MNGIERRHLAILGVFDSSRAWQRSTAEALGELLRPELAEGEVLPDLELLQRLFRRALERRWRRLLEAADRFRASTHRRKVLVAKVRRVRKKLGRILAGLRARLADLFGVEAARDHFVLRGATSEVPEEVLRQAMHTSAWLRDPSRSLPESPYPPSMEDRGRWAEPVEATAAALEPLIARASRAGQEVVATRDERVICRDAYDELFVAMAGWLSATYVVAGRNDRARAVRPSKRRKGLRLLDERRKTAEKTAGDNGPRHRPEPRRRTALPRSGRSANAGAIRPGRDHPRQVQLPRAAPSRPAAGGQTVGPTELAGAIAQALLSPPRPCRE